MDVWAMSMASRTRTISIYSLSRSHLALTVPDEMTAS